MTDELTLEHRVAMLESFVQGLMARSLVEGQIAEFLLSWLFFEKGIDVENAIKDLLIRETGSANVPLSDPAAVWWSDAAVMIEPSRTQLLERVERRVAGLRRSAANQP